MPSFITVKKWILEAAAEHGAPMSTRRAKSLAAAWLAQPDPLDYLRLTYADPVGESIVRRWMDYTHHMEHEGAA